MLNDRRVALVDDLDELGARQETAGCWDRVFQDFEILLAVEQHHGVEVGDERVVAKGRLSFKGWDDTEAGEDLEVFGSLTVFVRGRAVLEIDKK